MEIIISAFIGAASAIIVALIKQKTIEKEKTLTAQALIKELNIHNENVYIVDSRKKHKKLKFESKGSSTPNLIIIK